MTGYSQHGTGSPSRFLLMGVAAFLTLTVLAGCGGGPAYLARNEFVPFTPEQKTGLEAEALHAYRIQEGDVLKVYFAYEPKLNQDFVHVLSDGSVSLVGIDPIRLSGLTISEADSALTQAYSKEYREPALSVMIQETQGRRVYVLGQVRSPGLYKVPQSGVDIMNAVTMAGGFTDDAARKGTLIVRVTSEGYQVHEVNLESFGEAQFVQLATIPLQTYDIVYVPRTRVGDFNYFARTVLAGIMSVTRIVYDLRYITSSTLGRY